MDVTVNFKGGGSFVNLPPVFSQSGESIFVCCKNSILEYGTKTGKIIYEYKTFEDDIVGFSYHKFNSFDSLSICSKSGKIVVWKTVTHFKQIEKQIPQRLIETYHMVNCTNGELKALVSYTKKKQTVFALFDINSNTFTQYDLKFKKDTNQYHIAVSEGNYFSVVQGNNVYFVKFEDFHQISRGSIDGTKTFTCIACHHTEEIVLTGDSLGRVIAWQNIFSKKKIQSVFHWHTLPVQTVRFSASGSYFYSGGDECVLVKWQLDDVNDRRFVPRLASEINHVTVANNNLYVALSTRDNAVRILDTSLNQVTLIQHLVLGKHYASGIAYDHRTKALIMNGNQGQIQFYSPNDMSLLYSLDMVGQNKITDERDRKMINTEITQVDISKCGLWLATIEERQDTEFNPEVRLKFWKFDEAKQLFELNTHIEYPHEESVNSMLFQPTNTNENLCCVTVGNDKKFKVWQLTEYSTVYKKGVHWTCLAVGFHRNMNCRSLSFSADGSLMATGFGALLTTWLPDSCKLKCSLIHPIYKENIKQVQFGYGCQCHLLVAVSKSQISVWNLLTLSLVWVVPMPVAFVVADPLSSYMAVLTVDSRVFIFSPASPAPVYTSDMLNKYDIVAAKFVPSKYSSDARMKWFERSQIYFITSTNELYCLSSNEITYDTTEEILDEEKTSYASSLPQVKKSSNQPADAIKHLFEKDIGHKAIKKYLEGPLHTMAPIRFTCYSLIRSLAVLKNPS